MTKIQRFVGPVTRGDSLTVIDADNVYYDACLEQYLTVRAEDGTVTRLELLDPVFVLKNSRSYDD